MLAVMPSDGSNGVDEANAFLTHVQTTYPGTADHWQALHSEGVFMDIVSAVDYASAGADAGFSFGIVFSSGSPDWEYKASASNKAGCTIASSVTILCSSEISSNDRCCSLGSSKMRN